MRLAVLLRGVNVGGKNRVPMADFRALLGELGATNVVTLLNSGQAALDLPDDAIDGFETRVHDALADKIGVDVAVLIRTHPQLTQAIAANPFPEKVSTPKLLHLIFTKDQPDAAKLATLGTRHGDDELVLGDRVIYTSFAGTSHDSPLIPVLRKLGGVQTGRNVATVLKLIDLTA